MKALLVAAAVVAASSPALAGSIEGTVREAGTRRPVPAVEVDVLGSDVTAVSDDQGAFILEFENTRAREATLVVDTPGFERAVLSVKLEREGTTSVDVYLVAKESGETTVRERRSRDNIARGAHHIEGHEVDELPGTYGDPAKAIENFPGMGRVFLSQGSLFIRGAQPNESAVFVDDYEIPDLYHFVGSTSVINAPFVESVELVPGAFSARYGRSTGGIVTLKTKKLPTDDVHGLAKADVIDGGAFIGVPLAPNLAVGASARRSFLDLIRNAQRATSGTGDGVLLVPTYWDYQLKIDWDPAPGQELAVFAFGSGDREENVADGRGAVEPFLSNKDSDFHRLSLRYQRNIGGGFTHTFTPVIGYARETFDEQGGVRFKNTETFDAQLRDELTYRSRHTRVIVGLDATARSDAITYGGLFAVGAHAGSPVRELSPVDLESFARADRIHQQTFRGTAGLYIEGTVEPLDEVLLTPGLRVETYMLDGEPHVSLEPRFAGSWQVTPGDWGTLLKVAAGSFSRPPDPDELAEAHAEGFDLLPQQALHIQGGFDQELFGMVTVSTTLFDIWRDELTTKADTFPVPARFGERSVYSGGSGHSYGLEALARAGKPGKWYAWITYSITRNERTDAPSPFGVDYTYRQPFDTTHLLGVVGQTSLPWGFRVGARYRIATGMPDDGVSGAAFDADTGRFEPRAAPKDTANFPLFQSVDVRVDWTTTFNWFQLDCYADLVNVNTLFGRPVEGTFYNFDFTDTQPHLGLPLIPAIGAKASF